MEQKDFVITTIGGLADVSDLIVTEDTLNNNITLSDFGISVRKISFYALTYQDSSSIHEPFWDYAPKSRKIEGSLPLDFIKASSYIDKDAQRLVCEAIFELFDKVSGQVDDFNFEALKKAMLEAIETHPTLAEKIRFRIYSDTGLTTGDIPEFSRAVDLSRYGTGVKKLFLEASFFKNPKFFISKPPKFEKGKRVLYISIISSSDLNQFSSGLDKAIEKLKPQVQDFNFELFKFDILRFIDSLKEAV